ncbi:MAG: (2Fe-2S) ferredoxin domain-containing protein [Synechococcaceae cyanobacterium SM2_3_2]|nr:(2Fe-2S) ferredoxin domain-containing protein [Synechococcaceae cyanobacterium SM2_3_2]
MGKKTLTPFRTQGKFLGFAPHESGQPKYLRLQMPAGEYQFKVPKELRYSLFAQLQAGDWIQVVGDHQIKRSTGEEKWVAYQVTPVANPDLSDDSSHGPCAGDKRSDDVLGIPSSPHPKLMASPTAPRSQTILVCGKSDCMKRGGREVIATLQELIRSNPQADHVQIRVVGCMKDCKAGPNLVFMPDKSRYSRVSSHQLPALVQRHCPPQSIPHASWSAQDPSAQDPSALVTSSQPLG